ncbi:hypothetical protein ACQEU8_04685 [Streptomyces sp. CA-250714]|uniref:hypothetical protein n=1 Tax=Streptomyces sp. CA-250714 TaxID=3240060 RepID=UPI003D8C1CDF
MPGSRLRPPHAGELLSTVKFTVQTLAAASELQRELTYDGLRAARANGSTGGRVDQGVAVRRGQGFTLRVSAVPAVQRGLLARCRPLDGTQGSRSPGPAQSPPRVREPGQRTRVDRIMKRAAGSRWAGTSTV